MFSLEYSTKIKAPGGSKSDKNEKIKNNVMFLCHDVLMILCSLYPGTTTYYKIDALVVLCQLAICISSLYESCSMIELPVFVYL